MEFSPLKKVGGFIATALVALVLVGCKGSDGRDGTDGTNGTDGAPGISSVVDGALMTPEQWASFKPVARVTGVTFTTGTPVVTFEIKDALGNGVKGLGFRSQGPDRNGNIPTVPTLTNLAFTVAKFIPEDPTTKEPSKWVNYIVTTIPATKASDGTAVAATLTRPTTDNSGTLVDNNNGTYVYTFGRTFAGIKAIYDAFADTTTSKKADLGDITYDATKIHRIDVQISGSARGTGSNTPNGVTVATAVNMENPVNVIYDVTPSTGVVAPAVREIAAIGKCNECHDKLAFHGGGRVEYQYCVTCHTDQRKFGYGVAAAGTTTTYTGSTNKFEVDTNTTTAAGDMPVMVHKIHMGKELTKTGYNYANVKFEQLGYSMLDGGQRMCAKCHSNAAGDPSATPQGENWNTKPSRKACGACHDSVDFSVAHEGQVRADDSTCATACHTPALIKEAHYTLNVTPHNPVVAAGLTNFTYEISSVTQATSGGSVDIKFRILASTDGSTPAPVTLTVGAGASNPLTGFTGAPGFLLAWAMPQPGETTTPADYNNLKADGTMFSSNHQPISLSLNLFTNTSTSPSRGSISATPDSNGYYTVTVASAYAFPAGAKLRTVALQGYFTQVSPAAARHAISVSKAVSTAETRRKVIDSAKCANCHEWFEGHGGNRVYDVQVCVTCHVPGLVTSGKGISNTELSTYYNAGLFTEQQKASLASWTGVSFATDPTVSNPEMALKFPQVTNNMKDMIHGIHAGKDRTTNTFKIVRNRAPQAINVIDGGLIGFPGKLTNCFSCHTYNGVAVPANTLASRYEAVNVAGNTTTALAKTAIGLQNTGDLLTTPFTASCASCHDSAPAAAHMRLNGGQILVARSALNSAGESCAVCHGVGSTYDPAVVHK
jgi:OmcA/MtrC family decaheme c-type cytochrome